MEKHSKNVTKTMNLKYQLQHGSMNLNYLVDNTQFQIFKIFQKKNMIKLLLTLQCKYILIKSIIEQHLKSIQDMS